MLPLTNTSRQVSKGLFDSKESDRPKVDNNITAGIANDRNQPALKPEYPGSMAVFVYCIHTIVNRKHINKVFVVRPRQNITSIASESLCFVLL